MAPRLHPAAVDRRLAAVAVAVALAAPAARCGAPRSGRRRRTPSARARGRASEKAPSDASKPLPRRATSPDPRADRNVFSSDAHTPTLLWSILLLPIPIPSFRPTRLHLRVVVDSTPHRLPPPSCLPPARFLLACILHKLFVLCVFLLSFFLSSSRPPWSRLLFSIVRALVCCCWLFISISFIHQRENIATMQLARATVIRSRIRNSGNCGRAPRSAAREDVDTLKLHA